MIASCHIGYLGPDFSHSHMALLRLAQALPQFLGGADVQAVTQPSIIDLIEALQAGQLAYGVVPVENSLEGSVREAIEGVFRPQESGGNGDDPALSPILEFQMPIQHCLARHPQAQGPVQTVTSHPMAYSQCRHTVRDRFGYTHYLPARSTSAAAQQLAATQHDEERDTHIVICSRLAVEAYGLAMLAEDANDANHNETRFLLMAAPGVDLAWTTTPWLQQVSDMATAWKWPLCIRFEDRVGGLMECLQVFAQEGLNLTRIESAPSRTRLGSYRFHLDVGLSRQPDADLLQALESRLLAVCDQFQSLPAYACLGQLSGTSRSSEVTPPITTLGTRC